MDSPDAGFRETRLMVVDRSNARADRYTQNQTFTTSNDLLRDKRLSNDHFTANFAVSWGDGGLGLEKLIIMLIVLFGIHVLPVLKGAKSSLKQDEQITEVSVLLFQTK